MEENRIPKKVFYMNLIFVFSIWFCRLASLKPILYMNFEKTSPKGRPRNRRQDEVTEDGRLVGGKKGGRKGYITDRNGRRS